MGSAQAGPKVAAILSVVESCRRLDVPVKEYFAAVLPGLSNRTLSDVANPAPARWSASRRGPDLVSSDGYDPIGPEVHTLIGCVAISFETPRSRGDFCPLTTVDDSARNHPDPSWYAEVVEHRGWANQR